MYECWSLDEFERQPLCPAEIAEEKAGTVIIDKNDDSTGGMTWHRTNVMFMQPKKWIRKVFEEPHKAVANARDIKTNRNCGVPNTFIPICCTSCTYLIKLIFPEAQLMKKKLVTHALLRSRKGDDISPNEQGFTGFMASVFPKEDQLKPYYQHNKTQPTKTVIEKAKTAAVCW